jgi:asparagine synthase (glutamine-hydrolysing)
MCAIIGVLGKLPSKNKILSARDSMKHRGPNDAGLYYDTEAHVALGHRRLSIIDLSDAGRQPFFSNDGRFVLTYNGEIYNYLEIRKELERFYDFKTKTDTEVIIAAYQKWGKKCLDKFNGMFAFAIWDTKKQELFCARDRLGVKPFFYCLKGDTLYFASEIKGLLALGITPKQNDSVIFQYLHFGIYDHSDETFFERVKRLPAGSYFIWKNKKATVRSWWRLEDKYKDYSRWSKVKIENHFRELVADAIKIRFRSDVPVGISLSSGLDSNILLFYANRILKNPKELHLLSRCFKSNKFNECSVLEKRLSTAQKQKWHTSYFSPREALSLAHEVNKVEGEPFGGFSTVGGYQLHKKYPTLHVPVILEGQGLDEFLAGYRYYRTQLEKDVSGESVPSRRIHYRDVPSLNYSQDMTPLLGRETLSKKFTRRFKNMNASFKTPFSSHLLNAQYQDIVYTKLPRVLRINDHVSMSHGRELRMPYLDYRIVEFCFFLPPQYKIQADSQKVLARDAMKKYIPNMVHSTQKKAFGAVQVEWLRRYYKKEILSLLASSSFKRREYWDHAILEERVLDFLNGKGENSFFIWQCINLEMWLRQYVD